MNGDIMFVILMSMVILLACWFSNQAGYLRGKNEIMQLTEESMEGKDE